MLIALGFAAVAQAHAQAQAQDRDHKLLDLAYVLGEAHALRQACSPEDQMWRERMRRMLEVEAPSEALEARLSARFNVGYADARHRVPRCIPAAARAEAAAAKEGERLSRALAQSS